MAVEEVAPLVTSFPIWGMRSDRHKPSVLLVEDDESTRLLLRHTLMAIAGFEVREAADASTAMHECSTFKPDLVLLDLAIPFIDGFQIATGLRTLECMRNVPIVALTSYAGIDIWRERALKAGCNECLSKASVFGDLDEFVNVLRDRLASRPPELRGCFPPPRQILTVAVAALDGGIHQTFQM